MLHPLPGATEVKAVGGDGVFEVSYVVDSAYPAADVLAAIAASIPPEWTPRSEDSLNPGLPTSHVRGWGDHENLTTTPESWAHTWQSEWQNQAGDVLSYNLIYTSTGPFPAIGHLPAPDNSKLRVAAQVVPRGIHEQMIRFARWQMKQVARDQK